MEVNLLLQEIERFPGVVILTTNFYGSLDKALIRRIQFRVTFEEPDEGSRQKIWETLTPPETPMDPSVDYRVLAKHFEMTGGMIKNALIRAAYMSCDAGLPLTQKVLEESCLAEYQAVGKVARDPASLPAGKLSIPEGAVPLPDDWQERGIPPELFQQSGGYGKSGYVHPSRRKDKEDDDDNVLIPGEPRRPRRLPEDEDDRIAEGDQP